MPVIGYDENSKEAAPVYEYNSSNKVVDATLVNGWATFEYKLNPANVNPKYYTGVSFVEKTATVATKAVTEIGLPIAKVVPNEDRGKLIVKATAGDNAENQNAFKMFTEYNEDGTMVSRYNNPVGKPFSEADEYGEVKENGLGKANMLAYVVKNTNEQLGAAENVNVVSDYVAAKRMVVEQQETTIAMPLKGTDRPAVIDQEAQVLTELTAIYKLADVTKDGKVDQALVNAKVAAIQPLLKLKYTESLDLNTVLKGIATKFHTNTGFNAKEGQYLLTDLGFENVTFKYELMSNPLGEVDQTFRYLKLDGSTISVINQQDAAIDREPVLKVQMYVDGVFVMTKLLKIKITQHEQLTEDFINKDLLPQTLACSPIYGGGLILDQEVPFKHVDTAGELDYLYKVDGLKIDFDQYFNKLKISKEKFVEYYGANPVVEVKKDGEEFTGWSLTADDSKNLRIDYSNVSGTATTLNNYIYFGLKPALHAGTYVIKFKYATTNKLAEYGSFTITTTLVVKDPKHVWVYNPSMWNGTENMLGYGQPTSGDYDTPFLMKAVLEDGFKEPAPCCGNWTFAIADATIEATDAKIVLVGGKHELQILKKEWMDKKIRIKVTEELAIGRTIDNYVSAGAESKEFDIVFPNPVAYTPINASAWYLVDQAPTATWDNGAYLPIYRFIKLYDTHRGETTNGLMYDGSQKAPWAKLNTVESGKSLFKMHQVKVSYELSDKNNDIVKRHASIVKNGEKEVGLLKWENTGGAAVGSVDQPIVINVTIENTWMGDPAQTTKQVHEVTVYVKKADTKYTKPSTGFLGTLAAPEGLGSYADLN